MKTAISLPDDLFIRAEKLAKRMNLSRSQLYGRALDEYLSRHASDAVTEALNRVCAEAQIQSDIEFVTRAARRTLERLEW